MNESLRLAGKRALTLAIAVATIAWSIGLSAFVAPLTANAATPGSLVKGETLSTVYYYSTDGSRYAFPNEKTYFTWYSDFSSVETISDSELAAIPLAGNIVYRPGSRFIKIQSDDKTYAVTPQGHIRWIENEATAQGLAGDNWNQFIDDVPDVFFVDYTVGASLTSAANGYNGMMLEEGGSNYLIWNGEQRMVTSAGFTANRMQQRFFVPGDGVDLAAMPDGSNVSSKEGALANPTQQDEQQAPSGSLNVSLASDTPVSQTVPGGADSVEFTKFKWEGDASVDQVVVRLGGIGAASNIDSAYLYQGSTRLTDGRSVNSTTREATFSALGLDVSGTTYTTVRADVADTSNNGGDTANFGIESASKVSSSASVSGSFPVTGNTMTFSSQQAGTVTLNDTGSIDDPTIGQQDATVGRFTVEADGEDAMLHEITLSVDDAADHSDFKLWQSNDLVASCDDVGNDLVSCVLPNAHLIEDGDTENFKLSLDVGGEADDNIIVAVEEPADVSATGADFGFNMSVDITSYDSTNCTSSSDCNFSTIQGGDLTFVFNGPSSGDIQIDGDDQVLMNFAVTAENWTEIDEMVMNLDCVSSPNGTCGATTTAGGLYDANGDANFTNLTLRRANGSTWMGPEELASTETAGNDDNQDLTYTDNQIIQGGETVDVSFTVDVENTATSDDVIRGKIDMSEVVAEDANGDSLDNNSDITPSSDITGNQFTLQDASLDVALSQPPSSGTYVKGASNVDVVSHNFTAGDTSDVNVTDLTLTATGSSDAGDSDMTDEKHTNTEIRDAIASCSLYDGQTGALVDGPESPNTTGTNAADIVFDSFSWTVAGGSTSKLIARCNFQNIDALDSDDDDYELSVQEAADITAEDEDGDSVTATSTATFGSNNDTQGTNNDDVITTITDNGSVVVTLDGSSPKADIILGSSTGVLASVFEAEASDESFEIQELTLANCVNYDTADEDDCTGGTNEADGADDIASNVVLTYENEAGETVTKTSSLSNRNVAFKSLALFVPNNDDTTFSASIDTNAVSSVGADSGDQIQLNLVDGDESTNSFTTSGGATYEPTFKAVGRASGETVRDLDGGTDVTIDGIAAKPFTVRKTKPTITLHSSSPSGAATPSFSEVLRFNVAADSRGSVELVSMLFKVNATDNASTPSGWDDCDTDDSTTLSEASKWEFYEAGDPSNKLDDDAATSDWTFLQTNGADCTATANDMGFAFLDLEENSTTSTEEIGAGSTKTYVVKVDTSGASSSADDSFRLDIPDETEANGLGTDQDAIQWLDGEETASECNEANASTPCIDGSLIKNLPVTGGTLVY